mgnify:CR=1 FL=1
MKAILCRWDVFGQNVDLNLNQRRGKYKTVLGGVGSLIFKMIVFGYILYHIAEIYQGNEDVF